MQPSSDIIETDCRSIDTTKYAPCNVQTKRHKDDARSKQHDDLIPPFTSNKHYAIIRIKENNKTLSIVKNVNGGRCQHYDDPFL